METYESLVRRLLKAESVKAVVLINNVKHWPEIKNPKKYAGQRVVIGSVTDGYNPQEEQFGNTKKLLEQLIGSDADILICTKSDLVVRDIDLLKKLGRVTVSWSINTLDENFKNDMDSASSIERRIAAMKQVYEAPHLARQFLQFCIGNSLRLFHFAVHSANCGMAAPQYSRQCQPARNQCHNNFRQRLRPLLFEPSS